MAQKYSKFEEFYPFYLSEHSNTTCRRMHFVGSTIALLLIAMSVITLNAWLAVIAIVQGYAWAWVGHFFFEHNKPASFKQPLYSFAGDWVMYKDILTGKIKW